MVAESYCAMKHFLLWHSSAQCPTERTLSKWSKRGSFLSGVTVAME